MRKDTSSGAVPPMRAGHHKLQGDSAAEQAPAPPETGQATVLLELQPPQSDSLPEPSAATVQPGVLEAADESARFDTFREVAFRLSLNIDERQLVHNTAIKLIKPAGGAQRTALQPPPPGGQLPADRWAGWDTSRLETFISQWADLPNVRATATMAPQPVAPGVQTSNAPALQAPARSGTCRLDQFKLVGALGLENALRASERSHFILTLSLSGAEACAGAALHYQAIVSARRLDGPKCQLRVAEREGLIQGPVAVQIELDGPAPPPGLYHLTAAVSLASAAEPTRTVQVVSREIDFVQVA